MKRIIILITALVILFSSNAYAAEKRYPLTMNIDGKDVKITTPFPNIYSENMLLPMHVVLKRLGYKIKYTKMGNDINPVVAEKGGFYFSTYTGENKTWLNDFQINTKSKIITIKHEPYIQANYLKEVLDLELEIDKKGKKIKIKNNELKILTDEEIKTIAYKTVVMLKGHQASNYNYTMQGSGFIISDDGKIVTNYHIIKDLRDIQVVFNGKTVSGTVNVLGYDKVKDIAIIKINESGLIPLLLGNSNFLPKDEDVITISSPNGEFNKLGRGKTEGTWYSENMKTQLILTEKITDHGSSGGPLFNKYGEVIGINVSGGETYSLAIPINELKNLKLDKNLTLEELYKLEGGK